MRTRLSVLATLWLVALMAVVTSGANAEPPQDPGATQTERTEGEAVGASIAHPAGWRVEREPYTYDGSYGYTLWRQDTDAPHNHGGMPAVRVARAYDLRPGQIEEEVEETLAYYAGEEASVGRTTVDVGEEGHEGVAVGLIPGSTPFTRVYVPVNGRVYRINVYAEPGEEGLDADERELLSAVRFYPPQRAVSSLDLPGANSPEALYGQGDPGLLRQEEAAAREVAASEETSSLSTRSSGTNVPTYGERRIFEGCWLAKSPFFFQTQHGKYANRNRYSRPHGGSGWSRIGLPNYWGQYTHGNLGYGRCKSRYWTNDKFAIDYPLTKGDVVFSPFNRGRITFAGRNESHKNYGIFVVIRHDNGKYVSMSAHLSGLNRRVIQRGRVTEDSIIGYAGKSGDPSIPVGPVHLHQAFYRYPKFLRDGSPYGGAGLQVLYHHYVGTAAGNRGGVYKFGWSHTRYQKAKGDFISN